MFDPSVCASSRSVTKIYIFLGILDKLDKVEVGADLLLILGNYDR